MKNIILLIGIIGLLLISGCSSGYKDCMVDCMNIKGFTFDCAINPECELPDAEQLKKECFNECK